MKKDSLIALLIHFIQDEGFESKFVEYCIECGLSQEEIEDAIDEFNNANPR